MCFGVESDIVGYDTIAITNGSMGAGATFLNIGSDGVMSNLTVSGYTRPYTAAGIYCTLLNTYGVEIKKMYWFDNDKKSGKIVTPARYGWYNQAGKECYNNDPIAPGQGLWITQNADYSLHNAGQVINGTFAVALTNGSQYVSNPTPVGAKMGNVHITGYTRPYTAAGIYCSMLNTYGVEIKKMYWFDNDKKSGKIVTPARYGWYDQTGKNCYNDTDVIKPGEALWMTVNVSGLQLVWPSAIPAAE